MFFEPVHTFCTATTQIFQPKIYKLRCAVRQSTLCSSSV